MHEFRRAISNLRAVSRKKIKKPARRRVQIDVQKLDNIAEKARQAPISDEEYELLTTSIHTMAARLMPLQRSTEKADALCNDDDADCGKHNGQDVDGDAEAAQDEQPARRGHGRRPATDYKGTVLNIPHPTLTPACLCPACSKGKVYDLKPPRPLVRIVGMPPIQATIYNLQQLRCNVCGNVFATDPPDGVGDEKYDASVNSMIAQLKYGYGMTFYRIARLQVQMGVPMPTSVLFELVDKAAAAFTPVHAELARQAAQGEVLHHDDTAARILEDVERPEDQDEDRTGLHTTNIVAKAGERQIALFITGPQHGGENMTDLLKQREQGLASAVLMTDALKHNDPKVESGIELLLSNCLLHGRRKFVDIYQMFPSECHFVIEQLGQVYWHDEQARQQGMDVQQRLELHKQRSAPVMADLKRWMKAQIEQRKTEPNSRLGSAINYFLKRWHRLTLFLEHPGAPLDNNVAERALKKIVLHRKNALFFKTQHGADVGDIYFSVIHTCELNGVNAFNYMTEIQRHADEVRQRPAEWLPWNFEAALARAAPA